MANQVISVNHKKYAVGLFWQPVGVGVSARNYAHTLSLNVDKKLNLYTEYQSMVALGGRKFGQRPGMLSAAAEVMDGFAEYTSFLAVFQVDKKFYFVAARNGIILEDRLFDSEDDARQEYVKLSEIPDWGAFFAPGTWGMPRAAERNLADLLLGQSHANLHFISWFGTGMVVTGLIAFFILGLVLIFSDSVSRMFESRTNIAQLNPEQEEQYRRELEEKSKELDEQFNIEKVAPPEPIVMPYELLPNVMARADLCYRAMGFLMQPIPGWNQVNVVCGETHVNAEFKRSFGTLAEFYAVANELMPGVWVQEIDEDLIRVRARLPELGVESSQDERGAETIVRDITSAFQGIDTTIDTEIVVDTLTNGVDVATVNVVEIAVASKLTPRQFMRVFDGFDGVYMMQASWNVRSRMWNYEVIIYAK